MLRFADFVDLIFFGVCSIDYSYYSASLINFTNLRNIYIFDGRFKQFEYSKEAYYELKAMLALV